MIFFSRSFFAYLLRLIMPMRDEVSIILSSCAISFFLMLFLMDVVLSITSNNHTLDDPSLLFTRNCDCTQINASATLSATLDCTSGGKNHINLLIVCDAELVCNVLTTKCPVSAKLNTASAVSLSRISPTKMISGS